jgi:hypothetical protein
LDSFVIPPPPRREFLGPRLSQLAFTSILIIGLILRFYQYLMGRSLWEDETHLALNFMSRGFLGLAQPLDYIQGAPILFLWLVKLSVTIFGYGELAFRAVPFMSSILTLPLFYAVTRQLTTSKTTALIAFFIFSVNPAIIFFSSELKQYAVEVAVYLALTYLALASNEFVSRRRNTLLAIIGSICIFLSSTAFIILFCIACNFMLNWYRRRKINMADFGVLIPWTAAFLANFFLFIYHHPSIMQQRANFSFAFCPTNVLSCEFITFLRNTIEQTFFTTLLYISKDGGFAYVLLFIFFIAIRHIIIRKQYTLFFFVCVPILFHLLLSALKLYPFWYRLILYLLPCFIILISLGTTLVADFLQRKWHQIAGAVMIIYCCYFLTKDALGHFPLWFREIKPTLSYVNDSLPLKEHVYITDPVHAYAYYFKRGYVKNKIFKEVPWEIDPPEYYDMVYHEDSNYILFYSTLYQWGYDDVLKDLNQKGLILRTFQYKGYAVSEVKPAKRDTTLALRIDRNSFDPSLTFEEDKAVAIWAGSVVSKPVQIKAGKYIVSILSRGTSVKGEFPRNRLFINDQLVGEFTSIQKYATVNFLFETDMDLNAVFKITMMNDDQTPQEDRNTFIKAINVNVKK